MHWKCLWNTDMKKITSVIAAFVLAWTWLFCDLNPLITIRVILLTSELFSFQITIIIPLITIWAGTQARVLALFVLLLPFIPVWITVRGRLFPPPFFLLLVFMFLFSSVAWVLRGASSMLVPAIGVSRGPLSSFILFFFVTMLLFLVLFAIPTALTRLRAKRGRKQTLAITNVHWSLRVGQSWRSSTSIVVMQWRKQGLRVQKGLFIVIKNALNLLTIDLVHWWFCFMILWLENVKQFLFTIFTIFTFWCSQITVVTLSCGVNNINKWAITALLVYTNPTKWNIWQNHSLAARYIWAAHGLDKNHVLRHI